jgi:threonyl-tRNA synthetase
MYPPMTVGSGPGDAEQVLLRPSICPHHALIYRSRARSYRDLPLRIAELGGQHRSELSGVLGGLTRVRAMQLNDGHIFCAEDQVASEAAAALGMIQQAHQALGIAAARYRLSLVGPGAKYVGSQEGWDRAAGVLAEVLVSAGLPYEAEEGEAAFYGPKIDVKLVDAIGRPWQLSTVQFDFTLPRRFELEYIAEDGKAHQPLMVHRALYGSIERFFGILIEHYAGAFPVWLAPVQAIVLPITDRQTEYARSVQKQLDAAGIRATVDDRSEKVNLKIREAQLQKIPYMLVVGDREQQNGQIAVRNRKHGDQGVKAIPDFLTEIQALIDSKAVSE